MALCRVMPMLVSKRVWRSPPLVFHILLLLFGGLVVAQVATLFLTLVLPPAPPPQHSLDAVAAALRGDLSEDTRLDRLERVEQAGPPDLSAATWQAAERSRAELAGLLGVTPDAVRLAFYTPLPFAGMPLPPPPNRDSQRIPASFEEPPVGTARLLMVNFTFEEPGGGRPRREGLGAPAGNGLPEGAAAGFPARAGRFPGPAGSGAPGGETSRPLHERQLPNWREQVQPGEPGALREPGTPRGAAAAPGETGGRPDGLRIGPPATGASLPLGSALPGRNGVGIIDQTPLGFDQNWQIYGASPAPTEAASRQSPPPPTSSKPNVTAPPVQASAPALVPLAPLVAPVTAPPITRPDAAPIAAEPSDAVAVVPATPRALFGLAPAPFVEGDFVAALRLPEGGWAVVRPIPEGFPNVWQRRVLWWFALSFALVAPFGWLFARRIVKPLSHFATAAEQLGRDPSALVLQLDGPAEVGRAAFAFNLMQSRLKSFVDDRTAMVGAISHDLRTPLTRLRFRIEEVDDEAIREGMIDEVGEMEAMIASVLGFIRDASVPGIRERVDLRTLVEEVTKAARMVGSDVEIESAVTAPVEVDALGIRRVLGNLVDNAVKYGHRARIRLVVDSDEASAEITDAGPGLPDDEMEQAFEPFYRGDAARSSGKQGSGLGLAVCRSIARAHGGDVRLRNSPAGFVAELRVPLIYGNVRKLAA